MHKGIEFPVSRQSYHKIVIKNNTSIDVFGYKNKQAFPIYFSKETLEITRSYC